MRAEEFRAATMNGILSLYLAWIFLHLAMCDRLGSLLDDTTEGDIIVWHHKLSHQASDILAI